MKKGHNRLTFEDILSKKFEFQVGGYNTLEVDKFFDLVNVEIANLNDEYQELFQENINLKNALQQVKEEAELLKLEIKNLKNQN